MKTTTIQLYNFDELSDEAKIKALSSWNEYNDYPFLEESLNEYLIELLNENGIKGDAKLMYSLSYCQGDGVCFEGNFEFQGFNISVKHDNGHYYHSNSVYIDAEIDDDGEDDLKTDLIELKIAEVEEDFKQIFKEICDKIEKAGYEQIEYEQSEENFKELCDANEYTFESDGTMRNL